MRQALALVTRYSAFVFSPSRLQAPLSFPSLRHSYHSPHNSAAIQGVGALASSVLISILITFLVIVLVLYLIGRLPLDGRAKQIAQIVVIIIGIIALLKYIAVF